MFENSEMRSAKHIENTSQSLLPDMNTSVPIMSPNVVQYANGVPPNKIHNMYSNDVKNDMGIAELLRERCRQICISAFFHERDAVTSVGFTSASSGEGKSFLSLVSAETLAVDSNIPVTLIECNWEHPYLREHFALPPGPGLAEWLRGEADIARIRCRVSSNLTIISAGNARQDEIKLLQQLCQKGYLEALRGSDAVVIVDLPSVATTAYGPLAASIVEALIIVVQAGVTPIPAVAETRNYLKELRVLGVILNQFQSAIPRWLRQLL